MTTIEQDRFYNAVSILLNLNMDQLVEAGVIAEGNTDNGGSSWKRFSDDTLVFIRKLPDAKWDALWKLIESEQPERLQVSNEIGQAVWFTRPIGGQLWSEGVGTVPSPDMAKAIGAEIRVLHTTATAAPDPAMMDAAAKWGNARSILTDSVEILQAVLAEREEVNGEEDEVLRDLLDRIRHAVKDASNG